MICHNDDIDVPDYDEALPGAKKTKYAMKFKLETDRHLANLNKVSDIC